jgi:subtilase family serine protease
MAHRSVRVLAVALTVSVSACNSSSIVSSVPSVPSAPYSSAESGFYPLGNSNAAYPACPLRTRKAGEWRCFAWVRRDLRPLAETPNEIPAGVGYRPSDLASAYGLDPHQGVGQTVAVVDAYQYHTAIYDLTKYRQAAGLPPCTTSSGCLRVVNQQGKKSPLPAVPPPYEAGWLVEQALDLDAVSAVCPRCKIVLVETNTASGYDLLSGVQAALGLSKIVSMSFGAPEKEAGRVSLLPPSGYALVAGAGDWGGGSLAGGPQAPCVWNAVICVGGTMLTHVGNRWTSVVWNDMRLNVCGGGPCGATGSGCSTVVFKPRWQHDRGCRMRSEADVSADASVRTPLAVYSSIFPGTKTHPGLHWLGIAGTSLATPMIAAMIGLAGNASSLHGAEEIWEHHDSLTSVLKGTNVYVPVTGACASDVHYICVAGQGYDGPAGWGSPRGVSDL